MKKITILLSRNNIFITILLILLLSYSKIYASKIYNLDEDKISLINKIGNNLLFKGSLPLIYDNNNKQKYSYKELKSIFKTKLHQYNIVADSFLDDFFLINISLLNLTEGKDLYLQRNLLSNIKNDNLFINWPILSIKEIKFTKNNIKYFNLSLSERDYYYINFIEEILHGKYNKFIFNNKKIKPIIIYINDYQGCERVENIIAAYRITFMNNFFNNKISVIDKYNEECSNKMNKFTKLYIDNFCKYISLNKNNIKCK